MKSTACSFTGHRIIPDVERTLIKERLGSIISKLAGEGYTRFLCGGALGFDMMAAIEVIRLKQQNSSLRLILALPCRDWDKAWSEKYKNIYKSIIQNADEVIYVSETYTPGCMHLRNRYLINNSSKCVAYYSGRGGGTAYTVRYALENGVSVTNLKISG